MLDSHIHLHYFKDDLKEALADISTNHLLVAAVTCDVPEYKHTLETAEKSNRVLPAFGVHPLKAADYKDRLDLVKEYADGALMLGEIGLDRMHIEDPSHFPIQIRLFETLLESAQDNNTIMTIHVAGAEKETLDILDSYSVSKVIIHDYYGPIEFVNKVVDRGYCYSFDRSYREEYASEIPNWEERRRIASTIPDDLMLTETDGPNKPPSRTPSISLHEIIENLAILRNTTFEEIQDIVKSNFHRLVRTDARLSTFENLFHMFSE
ncbi:MAG: hypothetical protein EAX81_08225 [Candidatus Thorarchaeota archaeon]|nr:hypothetical protein [Candidatus Thorarchaeota archaeon]